MLSNQNISFASNEDWKKKNIRQWIASVARLTFVEWRPAFNKKHNFGWFLLKRVVVFYKVCSLHIISRNHSNTFLLINLQKGKTCPKENIAARAICSNISILTEFRQVFAHCLMSILKICKKFGDYIYQVVCRKFPVVTCSEKE